MKLKDIVNRIKKRFVNWSDGRFFVQIDGFQILADTWKISYNSNPYCKDLVSCRISGKLTKEAFDEFFFIFCKKHSPKFVKIGNYFLHGAHLKSMRFGMNYKNNLIPFDLDLDCLEFTEGY